MPHSERGGPPGLPPSFDGTSTWPTSLPLELRWTLHGLTQLASQDGTGPAAPSLVKARVWPQSAMLLDTVVEHLLLLAELDAVTLYSEAGSERFWLPPPLRYIPVTNGNGEEEGRRGRGPEAGARPEPSEPRPHASRTPLTDLELAFPPRYCELHPGGSTEECGPCGGLRKQRTYDLAVARRALRATARGEEARDE